MTARELLTSAAIATLVAVTTPVAAWAQNVVTMATGQIFRSIDPAKVTDYTDFMGVVNLYDGLTSVEPDGSIVPALAASWEVSADAREVTYTLRDDARFSDGSSVKASDVVYSVERLLASIRGRQACWPACSRPDRSLRSTPKRLSSNAKNFAPFLAVMPAIFILNEEAVKPHEGGDDAQSWLATNAAGAGPYGRVR